MTAQVAVMNSLGVALATDSAISIGNSVGADKVYASVDKLFRLSDSSPVAVMINDSADILGVPWEVVIKAYSKQLGDKHFNHLSDYAKDFFEFIRVNTNMFPHSVRDIFVEVFAYSVLRNTRREINRKVKSGEITGKNFAVTLREVVMDKIVAEKEYEKISGFNSAIIKSFRSKYGSRLTSIRSDIFKKHHLDVKTERALDTLVVESISRTNFMSSDMTEVVFAGFGNNEYMPSMEGYVLEGMVGKKLRYRDEFTVVEKYGVFPLAQKDTMETFLSGIHPDYDEYICKITEVLCVKIVDNVFDSTPNLNRSVDEKENFMHDVKKMMKSWVKKVNKKGRKSYSDPIIEMVGALPKAELASVAEMLVNLTKFHLRISPEEETVGGPTDVAVITKGDGFVWVKKKQYYPAELNPTKS